jgi:chemotaxis protein methyltransferase CheR
VIAELTRADVGLLSRVCSLELDAYRREHVLRATERAIAREHVRSVDSLAALLQRDAAARARYRTSVAVSVSGLFRDPEQFELLERTLLPPLLATGVRLTVWSAGCADGSELYSVALVLERLGALANARLLGSDVLEENIRIALRGVYDGTEIDEEIRRQARWEVRDLATAPPPRGPWRLILCRNVAIYLTPAAKERLMEALSQALSPGGILLLGRSERLAHADALGLERAGPHAYRRAVTWAS